jgi:hypothetical protein
MKGVKTGGRVGGTPNKITVELRKILKDIITEEFDSLRGRLDQLEPKERLEYLVKLMPFCLPKVDSIRGDYDTGWRSLDDE